jgi:hypothetical protein
MAAMNITAVFTRNNLRDANSQDKAAQKNLYTTPEQRHNWRKV